MKYFFSILLLFCMMNMAFGLPQGFVYLKDVAPTIQQEMRYVGYHNFVGRPIKGYVTPECILTTKTAQQLALVQNELKKSGLSLKVYDCYRPTMAVHDFMIWSKNPNQQEMKAEFYPRVNKKDVFQLGYVAEKSGHSRGSTMDLTIVKLPAASEPIYHPGQKLVSCFAPYSKRYRDNSIEMGTGFDCLDELAYPLNQTISPVAKKNRMLLRNIMMKYGFVPYEKEWWHFTLQNEAYPNTYFNFLVN